MHLIKMVKAAMAMAEQLSQPDDDEVIRTDVLSSDRVMDRKILTK